VAGREELPATETKTDQKNSKSKSNSQNKKLNLNLKSKLRFRKLDVSEIEISNKLSQSNNETDNKRDGPDDRINNNQDDGRRGASTLPLLHKGKYKKSIAIPKIQTSDGTNIYYICDLPKKIQKGLLFC
jgi:hypothetical protein